MRIPYHAQGEGDRMAFEDKSDEIKNLMAALNPSGQSKEELAGGAFCAICGLPISMDDFRDELSRREYGISRMCQLCQDSVFGGEDY